MSAWENAAVVFGVVLGTGGLFTLTLLGVMWWIDRSSDAVDEAYRDARAILRIPRQLDGSHDALDMGDVERDAEVAWLKRQYGPPVSPGRN